MFFNILIYLLISVLVAYVIYEYRIILNAEIARLFNIKRKQLSSSVQRNINVIIHVQNDTRNVVELITSLKNQDYPSDKYKINVILDNPTENTKKLMDLIPDIVLWEVNTNMQYAGMMSSVGMFFEHITKNQYFNGHVLLSSSDLVKKNFMSRVNVALEQSDISQGCLASISPYGSIFSTIGYISNRILNRVNNVGESRIKLGSRVLTSGIIISEEFVSQYPIQNKYLYSELDYNCELLKQNVKVDSRPDILIFTPSPLNIKDLAYYKSTTFYKWANLLLNNPLMLFSNLKLLSYALYSLLHIKLIQIIMVIIVVIFSYKLNMSLLNLPLWEISLIFFVTMLFMAELLSMLVSRCKPKDYLIWFISIFMYLPEVFMTIYYSFKLIKSRLNTVESIYDPLNNESIKLFKASNLKTLDVKVSDGTKNISCKLEIQNDDQNNHISLIFNNKKFTTKKHITLDQAFEELNKRLNAKNFKIICCYNCGYFNYSNKSFDESCGSKGHCFYDKNGQNLYYDDLVEVWGSCEQLVDLEQRNQIIENWKNSLA